MMTFGECHGHIFMDGEDYRRARGRHVDGVDEAWVRDVLAAYQRAGIRFFRDGGDAWGVGLYAARIAGEYGIDLRTPAFAIHQKSRYGGIVGRAFTDMHDYQALLLEAREQGADFIKIMCSGILDFQNGTLPELSLENEQIRAMIDRAHGLGFAVMAHVNGSAAVLACAEAGIDSVEHGYFLDEECLAAMLEHKTVWVPTLSTSANLVGCSRYPGEAVRRVAEEHAASVHLAFRMGVTVAAGSDAGAYRVPHVTGIADEVRHLCRAGEGIVSEAKLLERLRAAEEQVRERFRRR